ncbi:MAG: putative Ig domain-containing protein [Bryobacter sp.]|jgi:uncharacterized protein (TIGR03437 family)|nr:putative Ig domain-containing protein [Bryobacter sp. CoA8 C33]
MQLLPIFLWFLFFSLTLQAQCVSGAMGLPSIPPPYNLPQAEVGIDYSFRFQGANGQPPYRFFSYQNRPLPSGLTLSESGELSGRPTTAKPDEIISIILRDTRMTEANICEFRLTVISNRLAITSTTLPRATVGVAYSTTIAVAFGVAPFRFELLGGAVPPGIQTFSNGLISGTPTSPGAFPLRYRVADANNNTATAEITLHVDGPLLRLETTSLPAGEVGLPYSAALRLAGNPAGASFHLTSGALPPGLTLSPAGALSGNPTTPGTFNFTVRATTPTASTDAALSLRIATSSQPLTLQDLPVALFPIGLPVNTRFPTIGARGATNFQLLDGILPAGLEVSASGELTGTPRGLPGVYPQRWRAVDSSGAASERAYSLIIQAPTELTPAISGQRYTHRDSSSARFTLTPTTRLPLGLNISPDGALTGTPFAAGDYTFALRLESPNAPAETRAFSLKINAPPSELDLDTLDLPPAPLGTPYRQSIFSTPAPTSVNLFDGALPPGLSLQNNTISGTPTTPGYFEFLLDIRAGILSTNRRFAIAVEPAGRIAIAALTNSASYQGPAVAPGMILTLFGANLDNLRSSSAHILYSTPNQAALILPYNLNHAPSFRLVLTRGSRESLPFTLRVIPALPGIFTLDGSGSGPAAAFYQDSIAVLFGTGLGALAQTVTDAQPAPAANLALAFQSGALAATVNGLPASIVYAGAAPGLIAGVDQINVQLPPGLPSGPARLKLTIGSRSSNEVLLSLP